MSPRESRGPIAQIVVDEAPFQFDLPLEGVIDHRRRARAASPRPRRPPRRSATRSPSGSAIRASSKRPSPRPSRRRAPIMPSARRTPSGCARRWRGSASGCLPCRLFADRSAGTKSTRIFGARRRSKTESRNGRCRNDRRCARRCRREPRPEGPDGGADRQHAARLHAADAGVEHPPVAERVDQRDLGGPFPRRGRRWPRPPTPIWSCS